MIFDTFKEESSASLLGIRFRCLKYWGRVFYFLTKDNVWYVSPIWGRIFHFLCWGCCLRCLKYQGRVFYFLTKDDVWYLDLLVKVCDVLEPLGMILDVLDPLGNFLMCLNHWGTFWCAWFIGDDSWWCDRGKSLLLPLPLTRESFDNFVFNLIVHD